MHNLLKVRRATLEKQVREVRQVEEVEEVDLVMMGLME